MIVGYNGVCVDANVKRVVGHLLTNTVAAVVWDRNKTVTCAAEWPDDFTYPMALSTCLPSIVYNNMLTRTLYTLTGPVNCPTTVFHFWMTILASTGLTEHNCVNVLYKPFANLYPLRCSHVGSSRLQPSQRTGHNHPVVPPPPPAYRPGVLIPRGGREHAAVLCDESDAETYEGDDVSPVDVQQGLDLLSVHSSDLTEAPHYVMLDEERSVVPSSFLSSEH